MLVALRGVLEAWRVHALRQESLVPFAPVSTTAGHTAIGPLGAVEGR